MTDANGTNAKQPLEFKTAFGVRTMDPAQTPKVVHDAVLDHPKESKHLFGGYSIDTLQR